MKLPLARRSLHPALLSGCLLLGAPAHCCASAYLVSPVGMTLKGGDTEGEFQLVNQESHAVRVQVDVQQWSQEDNNNIQSPTTDFIVSPRFADIPARGMQIVRIAMRRPPSSSSESSYRVMFREISLPSAAGGKGFNLNYSVPLFVLPDTATAPRLAWTARLSGPAMLVIAVSNSGGSHAKLDLMSLSKGQDRIPLPDENSQWHYVLAGVTREIHLTPTVSVERGDRISLSVAIDGKAQELSLRVD